MNLNLIIENLAFFTVTAMNVAVVNYVANNSKNSVMIDFITLILSGALTIIFKDIVCLIYSSPFLLIKESSID
ncbi:hypothetical protein SAMN03159284_02889 [Mucilaginibacter sp. NFR10]|nr:hypothetical protein SAMN03159284_02889 [Mucilaginibacter sp. NFR10]